MKNIRFKKGEMLVETVVAMAVFALIMLVSFSVFKSLYRISDVQDEYGKVEAICTDIDSYYDAYGEKYWAKEFFGDYYNRYYKVDNELYELYDENLELVYPDPDFEQVYYTYILTYHYSDDNSLIVTIKNNEGKVLIDSLNYGLSQADDKDNRAYAKAVQVKNTGISIDEDCLNILNTDELINQVEEEPHEE